jgi:endonuclease/exonuclease/phosphatase family metal-dependent hydrolase
MRKIGAALVVSILALTGASGSRVSTASDTPATFRVATFNIHKGADREGHYNLDRTIDAIQRLGADVVGVQEVMRNHPDFHCDDQPALIADGLRKRTGRPWTHVHGKAWITDNRDCLTRGRGSDVATEELAIFVAGPILSSSSVRLSEGRVGLAARTAAMPNVPVIVTHLAANRDNQRDRIHELAVLLPWTAQQGPGILMGDLNAQPDSVELAPVRARYRDAWADAAAHGHVAGVVSGTTRPGRRLSRIDYVFYEPGSSLILESAEVLDVSNLDGRGEVSDHFPVSATFRKSAVGGSHFPPASR